MMLLVTDNCEWSTQLLALRFMKPRVSHDLFRERVRQVLTRSGLTYAGFARRAGLDRSTLSQLLTGPMPRLPRAETLVQIARTARVSVDWLLGLSQRSEMETEIIEAVMRFEPYGQSPAEDPYLGWVKAAQGLRICTVPASFPDLLKNETVLRTEFPEAFSVPRGNAVEAVAQRLDILRQPYQQHEVANSREAFIGFAAGAGRWSVLDAATRRTALEHMTAITEELYPSFRVYLYDSGTTFSAPFTVFGAQRVAVFLGPSYLLLNAASHVEMFARRFDDLIRGAVVQPHEFAGFLKDLTGRVG